MATPPMTKPGKSAVLEKMKEQKWLTLIVLPVLFISTFMGIYAFWGVLFIFWGLSSIRSGDAFVVEPIRRSDEPGLFWLINLMWVVFGVIYILADLYPETSG